MTLFLDGNQAFFTCHAIQNDILETSKKIIDHISVSHPPPGESEESLGLQNFIFYKMFLMIILFSCK